jgi:hypothetical protein
VRAGEELFLRERGVVRAIGRVRELRPAPTTWKLRQPLKGTAIYESRAFWTDLKPPRGEVLPPVHPALLEIDHLVRFEKLPGLALGALTRDETGLVLDFLEVGSSEDELARE